MIFEPWPLPHKVPICRLSSQRMELPNWPHKMARIRQEPLQKGYHLVPT